MTKMVSGCWHARYTDKTASLNVTLQNLDKLWVSASVISTDLSLYVCIRRRSCQPRCHTTRLGPTLGECTHTHIKYMYTSYHTHTYTYSRTLNICIHIVSHKHIHDLIKGSWWAHVRICVICATLMVVCVCVYVCVWPALCVFPWRKTRTCKLSDDSF